MQKKDRSRRAGSGQDAGGKPATGRLCQAGLRKMKAGVRHPAYTVNKRTTRLFQRRATEPRRLCRTMSIGFLLSRMPERRGAFARPPSQAA